MWRLILCYMVFVASVATGCSSSGNAGGNENPPSEPIFESGDADILDWDTETREQWLQRVAEHGSHARDIEGLNQLADFGLITQAELAELNAIVDPVESYEYFFALIDRLSDSEHSEEDGSAHESDQLDPEALLADLSRKWSRGLLISDRHAQARQPTVKASDTGIVYAAWIEEGDRLGADRVQTAVITLDPEQGLVSPDQVSITQVNPGMNGTVFDDPAFSERSSNTNRPSDGVQIGVHANGTAHVAWVQDVNDGDHQSALLYVSTYAPQSSSWSAPISLNAQTDDSAMFTHQAMLQHTGSQIVLTWMQSSTKRFNYGGDRSSSGKSINDTQFELMVAYFDEVTGQWSSPLAITDSAIRRTNIRHQANSSSIWEKDGHLYAAYVTGSEDQGFELVVSELDLINEVVVQTDVIRQSASLSNITSLVHGEHELLFWIEHEGYRREIVTGAEKVSGEWVQLPNLHGNSQSDVKQLTITAFDGRVALLWDSTNDSSPSLATYEPDSRAVSRTVELPLSGTLGNSSMTGLFMRPGKEHLYIFSNSSHSITYMEYSHDIAQWNLIEDPLGLSSLSGTNYLMICAKVGDEPMYLFGCPSERRSFDFDVSGVYGAAVWHQRKANSGETNRIGIAVDVFPRDGN